MIESKNIAAVGKFQKTHALKGELNAILDIDPEYFEEGNAAIVDIDGINVPFYINSIRPKGMSSFLVKLDGVDSEEDARQFVNKIIYAEKSGLAPFLDVDEEDIIDNDSMIGYSIIDAESGKTIGVVDALETSTQNLLFIVKTEDDEEIFIPAVEDFIEDINDETREIRMNLPEGILDLN